MDENTLFDQTKRQTINPLMDEINRQVEPLLKVAINEFGYVIPLAFRLYNQIRFYEEYGKLHLGVSVASKSTLAEQFGVTEKQVEDAFNNLTNRYKLGRWIDHDQAVFRNVKRTWVSITRYERGFSSYYAVIPEVLHGNTASITPYELASEVPPLSESKSAALKISENKKDTTYPLATPEYGKAEINELFSYWEERTGVRIESKRQANRNACNNLFKRYGGERTRQLIDGVALAQSDQYAPRIADFVQLQNKLTDLITWGKKRGNQGKVVVIS